jgi:hypothetical protein
MAKRRRKRITAADAPPSDGASAAPPPQPAGPALSPTDTVVFFVGVGVSVAALLTWVLWRVGVVSADVVAAPVLAACAASAALELGVFLFAGERSQRRMPVVAPIFLMALPAGAALGFLTNRPTGFALSMAIAIAATALFVAGRARPAR